MQGRLGKGGAGGRGWTGGTATSQEEAAKLVRRAPLQAHAASSPTAARAGRRHTMPRQALTRACSLAPHPCPHPTPPPV